MCDIKMFMKTSCATPFRKKIAVVKAKHLKVHKYSSKFIKFNQNFIKISQNFMEFSQKFNKFEISYHTAEGKWKIVKE